ncbi:MAG: hypothetical protein Q8910_04265 [Bacteroidota bacterium]|nr:hypothetical protein [Bacteroidota bacterium]
MKGLEESLEGQVFQLPDKSTLKVRGGDLYQRKINTGWQLVAVKGEWIAENLGGSMHEIYWDGQNN